MIHTSQANHQYRLFPLSVPERAFCRFKLHRQSTQVGFSSLTPNALEDGAPKGWHSVNSEIFYKPGLIQDLVGIKTLLIDENRDEAVPYTL